VAAVLLVGWATGGILFGLATDRLGRSRTLLLTMLVYATATAACASATDVWVLAASRFVAALGIGGEWAAGASLVAEVVPERRRVAAGALLYTSSPLGIFLATLVNDLFTKRIPLLAAQPDLAWRLVFLTGLLPAAVALWIRRRVREPEVWEREAHAAPRLAELFATGIRSCACGSSSWTGSPSTGSRVRSASICPSSSRRGCAAPARASATTRAATWPPPGPSWWGARSAPRRRPWTRSAGWRSCRSWGSCWFPLSLKRALRLPFGYHFA